MLSPKRVRWRKVQKGRMRGKAYRGSEVSFGDFGLQTLECGWLTARQIEAYTRHRRTHRSRRAREEEAVDPSLVGGAMLAVAFERENAIARAATVIGVPSNEAAGRRRGPLSFVMSYGNGARGAKSTLGELVGHNMVYASRSSKEVSWELPFFFASLSSNCKSGNIIHNTTV